MCQTIEGSRENNEPMELTIAATAAERKTR